MSEKTIKEFSEELNISKQALHYRVKQLPSKERQRNSQNIIVLTDEEQMIIKGLLDNNSQTDNQRVKERSQKDLNEKDTYSNNKDKYEKSYYDAILSSKQEQIDLLKELIIVKDARIDDLLKKIDKSNQLLDQQQRLTLDLQSNSERLTLEELGKGKRKWWDKLFS